MSVHDEILQHVSAIEDRLSLDRRLFKGEHEPIARNPILRGVDLAMDRLVRRDCFTERTIRIIDELRAEVAGVELPVPPEQYTNQEIGDER